MASRSLPASALMVEGSCTGKILSGTKVWELRRSRTMKRERVVLASIGAGHLLGEVEIVDCLPVGRVDEGGELLAVAGHEEHYVLPPANMSKHKVSRESMQKFRWCRWWAWVLSTPLTYPAPAACHLFTGAQQFAACASLVPRNFAADPKPQTLNP